MGRIGARFRTPCLRRTRSESKEAAGHGSFEKCAALPTRHQHHGVTRHRAMRRTRRVVANLVANREFESFVIQRTLGFPRFFRWFKAVCRTGDTKNSSAWARTETLQGAWSHRLFCACFCAFVSASVVQEVFWKMAASGSPFGSACPGVGHWADSHSAIHAEFSG